MRLPIWFLTVAVLFAETASGAARWSGEKGARPHQTRLSAGEQHTCAVLDDGRVVCWGRNSLGQLGDGTHTTRLSPVTVSGLGTAVAISAGSFHSCAVLSVGTVRCWGLNSQGQLGNGATTDTSTPVAVSGLTNVVSIAAGGTHSCAVRVDGSVWCWGAAIANGADTASAVPVKVNVSGAVAVTAGANHACALLAGGQAACWGQNASGQAGYYGGQSAHSQPALAWDGVATLTSVVEVSAGGLFSCARLAAGSVYCWRSDNYAQFGNDTITTGSPAAVQSFATRTLALATGASHTCAIVDDGTVDCWGNDTAGQLGYAAFYGSWESPHPASAVMNAVEIAAGAEHTCARIADGSIRCWGDNTYGQHGDGISGQTGTDSVVGVSGTFLGWGFTSGNQFTCGRRGNGAPACWGGGTQGQLGDTSNASSSNPAAVSAAANSIALAAGSAHACALDASGAVSCWGANSHGQLGDGTTQARNQAANVQGGLHFAAISAGDFHTCGITSQAPGGNSQTAVYCWGAGDHGQNGASADSSMPVRVGTYDGPAALATGSRFTCVLYAFGSVGCWGDNSSGQLGNGGTAPGAVLSIVPGLVNVTGIAAGANHACALTAFGSILCWGDNSRGQLGNNSTNPEYFPTTVQGITDAVSISAGAFFTCAAHADGTASCWGSNDSGELSAIDASDHLTPTLVGNFRLCGFCTGGRLFSPLQGVVAIATGTSPSQPTRQHACALLAGGVIDCWGNNSQGEIGDGTTTNRSIPTVVNSFAANVDPAASLRTSHLAEVTALIDCEAGGHVRILLSLEQDGITGSGEVAAGCQSRLLRVPVTIPAHGPAGFQAGAATAHVEAIVRDDDEIVEDTHWTRQVTLSVSGSKPEDR